MANPGFIRGYDDGYNDGYDDGNQMVTTPMTMDVHYACMLQAVRTVCRTSLAPGLHADCPWGSADSRSLSTVAARLAATVPAAAARRRSGLPHGKVRVASDVPASDWSCCDWQSSLVETSALLNVTVDSVRWQWRRYWGYVLQSGYCPSNVRHQISVKI